MNHGPWTTALGNTAPLSRFWRRRMTMLPLVARSARRMRWPSVVALLALGLLTFGLPSLLVSAADPDGIANDTDTKRTVSGEKLSAKEQPELSTFGIAAPADDVPPDTRVAIAGTCVDENHQPLADVEVTLSWRDRIENIGFGRGVAHTQSDNTGRFDFGTLSLVKAREYELHGVLAGRGYASADVDISQGDAKGIELSLPRCLPIRGKVVDQSGKSVSNAKVWVIGKFSGHSNFAITGVDGSYELDSDIQPVTSLNRIPIDYAWWQKNQLKLCAQHPDFILSVVTTQIGTKTVDFRLTPGATMIGHVVFHETGLPAAQAPVEIRGRFTLHKAKAITDAEGRYEINHLSPDLYDITLNDYRDGVIKQPIEIRVAAAKQQRALDLHVFPGTIIEGRVVSGDDKPVNFDKSALATIIADGPIPSDRRTTTVKPDGTFQMRVTYGFNRISISSQGWQALTHHVIMAREGERVPLEFRVIPKTIIEQVRGYLTSGMPILGVPEGLQDVNETGSRRMKRSSATNPDTKGAP